MRKDCSFVFPVDLEGMMLFKRYVGRCIIVVIIEDVIMSDALTINLITKKIMKICWVFQNCLFQMFVPLAEAIPERHIAALQRFPLPRPC